MKKKSLLLGLSALLLASCGTRLISIRLPDMDKFDDEVLQGFCDYSKMKESQIASSFGHAFITVYHFEQLVRNNEEVAYPEISTLKNNYKTEEAYVDYSSHSMEVRNGSSTKEYKLVSNKLTMNNVEKDNPWISAFLTSQKESCLCSTSIFEAMEKEVDMAIAGEDEAAKGKTLTLSHSYRYQQVYRKAKADSVNNPRGEATIFLSSRLRDKASGKNEDGSIQMDDEIVFDQIRLQYSSNLLQNALIQGKTIYQRTENNIMSRSTKYVSTYYEISYTADANSFSYSR